MYRGILQSIGITAQAYYHDYHRQLGQRIGELFNFDLSDG